MYQPPRDQFATARPMPAAYQPDPAEALVRSHGEMVRRIAWHVHSRVSASVELEDLIQVGLVALIEAARGYEDRGHAFSTYASTRVRGAMIDQLRRDAKMSRTAMANRRQISAARAKLEQQLMRNPDASEMAAAMGLALADYQAMAANAVAVEQASIDDHYSDHDSGFADLSLGADGLLEADEMRTLLAHSLSQLPEREAMVLQLFFVEELNLHEIGATMGVGAARICQIKKAALEKLRTTMAAAV